MAKSYRKDDFKKLMAKVVKIDNRVKMYLENVGYEIKSGQKFMQQ